MEAVRERERFDRGLLIVTILLLLLGLVAVLDASFARDHFSKSSGYDAFFSFKRQAIWSVAALVSLAIGMNLSYARIKRFWVVGLDYAIQLSVLKGLLNFVPLVGPVVATAAAGAVALCQWGSVVGLLKALAICALVRFVDDGVLQVVILKYSVELHPILILFALMAGGSLWGFWGLLFGLLSCALSGKPSTLAASCSPINTAIHVKTTHLIRQLF